MTHEFDIDHIAEEVKTAQDDCRQLETLSGRLDGFGIAEAYAVANRIHQMRMEDGAAPVGRKIGFTNPDIWQTYGVYAPIWGHVYDTTAIRSDGQAVTCPIGRFAEPRIEPEVVVHFNSAPPVTEDLHEILSCVDWIAHGIEIVQSNFAGWKFQAADTIADSALHAVLIIGEPREITTLPATLMSDLERFTITLSCNDRVVGRGRGSNALGGPLRAVAHLMATIANQSQPMPIQAGEIVTTGTLTDAYPILAGQNWTTHLDGIDLPGLAVSFEV